MVKIFVLSSAYSYFATESERASHELSKS